MITLIIREIGVLIWTTTRTLNGSEELSQDTYLLYLFGVRHNRYGPALKCNDTKCWYINDNIIPTYLEYLILMEQTKLQNNTTS